MEIILSEEQKKHYKAIRWLVSDARGQGKSYLLAIAFIEKALAWPSMKVRIFDHGAHQRGSQTIVNLVKRIFENYEMDNNYTLLSDGKTFISIRPK